MGVDQDQADTLRAMAEKRSKGADGLHRAIAHPPLVVTVASGKGGVGKTNISANLGLALAQQDARVLLLDGDLGLANMDLALGITPKGTLLQVLEGNASLSDVLTPGPEGLTVLPACSGSYDLANLALNGQHNLFSAVDVLEDQFDVLIVDAGAGIGANTIAFAGAAQHVLVVVTPEPTSLADAYGLIKVMNQQCGIKDVQLIANMVLSPAEGESVYRKLTGLMGRFLQVSVGYLGAVTRDQAVSRSIRAGVPLLVAEPRAPASQCIRSIARRVAALTPPQESQGGIKLFWKRLLKQGGSA